MTTFILNTVNFYFYVITEGGALFILLKILNFYFYFFLIKNHNTVSKIFFLNKQIISK